MPSDDPRVRVAFEALAGPIAEFRAAIAGALAQAEAVLSDATAAAGARADRAQAELGVFAEGRIDPAAFATLFARVGHADTAACAELVRAVAILRDVLDQGEQLLAVEVPPGGDLVVAISAAFAQVGRAFGAVQLAELVRGGRYRAGTADPVGSAGDYRHWNAAARRLVPPLVVSLDGADLRAAALSEFCDGRAKLVLLLRGPCAPAPLVRLITPRTFVLQTADRTGLDRLAEYPGPAVAALVPPGAARFLHDPAGGKEPWQRLTMLELPEAPRRALGGASAWQQAEDLEQLATLARTPFKLPARDALASPALGESDAVDRLATWLLTQQGAPGS